MSRGSQKAARDQQQPDSACAGCPSPDSTHGGAGPFVGVLPLLSRNGMSHPMGKFDAEPPKVRMHSQTVGVLQILAAEHGIPLSELVRIVLECVAYGTDTAASVAADRIRRVGQLMGANAPQPGGR